jgi:hypothetical protein
MARSLLVLAPVVFAGASPAEACTPPAPPFIRFEGNAIAVPADRLDVLRSLAASAKAHNPKCLAFDLAAFADPAEKRETAAARIDAVKAVLQGGGVVESQIVSKIETIAGNANPMARSVVVNKNWASGQWRCDPASHNPNAISAACQKSYTRCYLQLSDGTVCNPENVANPNPVTYSVAN